MSKLPAKKQPIVSAVPSLTPTTAASTETPLPQKAIAVHSSIPYWDQENAFASVRQHPDKFETISMFWYYVNSDLDIATYEYAHEDESMISFAHEHKIKILALVTNLPDEEGSDWSSDRIREIITSDEQKTRHIEDLVQLVEEKGFDGINVDYEELDEDLKDDYSNFIRELVSELHKRGKIVGVAIHPKSGEDIPSEDNGSRAQDWVALGRYADQLYFMTHGEHWDTSAAGPLASIPGDSKVIAYAKKLHVPPQKIYLGIPLFAMRWESGKKEGKGLLYTDVEALIKKYSITPQWDNNAKVPYIRYSENGTSYEVWYENTRSVKEKIKFAEQNGLGGITYWRLGGEDPGIWK